MRLRGFISRLYRVAPFKAGLRRVDARLRGFIAWLLHRIAPFETGLRRVNARLRGFEMGLRRRRLGMLDKGCSGFNVRRIFHAWRGDFAAGRCHARRGGP
jgi:hypothetical protein